MIRVDFKDARLGDLGFHDGTAPASEVIERVTATKEYLKAIEGTDLAAKGFVPSHAFIVCSETQVIESLEKTKIRPLAVYADAAEEGRVVLLRPDAPDVLKRRVMEVFVKQYDGAAYGWLQIVGFLPVLWWRRLTGRRLPNPMPLGVICSEAALLWLRMLWFVLTEAEPACGAEEAKLRWVKRVGRNTTDPALLLACCLHDAEPGRRKA